MVMRLLRELSRRKLRTALTITGITIGIWALVVFSSMANKINGLVGQGTEFYADKIIVTDGENFSTSPIRLEAGEEIAEIAGVAAVDAQIQVLWEADGSGANFAVPDMVIGLIPGADAGHETFALNLATGRMLTADDNANVVVLGSTLAQKHGVAAGDYVEIRGASFEVLGTLEPTLTSPDTNALIPLATAQQIYLSDLPPLIAEALVADELVNQIVVYPEAGADIPAVAADIEANVENTATMTGADFDADIGATTAIFNAIIIGVAAISLVVGGLSVVNTMAMSVAERTREIGIKRAIGGPRGRIIRELVAEAGVIGLIGGLIGLGLGAVAVVLANEAGRASGTVLFELTVPTALFTLAFSTILGMLAGIIPAWSAARLDPVSALRYE
jgi:putative ABC transport system permease protein